MHEVYDVAIVGTGPVGLASAMYSGRFNMKTLVIGELLGGTITTTETLENYPGFKTITSGEFISRFEEHAKDYDVDMVAGKVELASKDGDEFVLKSGDKEYRSKTVIIATGTKVRKLGLESEEKLANRGVSYCALCDGAFFKDKEVAVVGGGDGAAVDALLMTKYAKKVYMIVRKDSLRAEPSNQKKLEENEKIEFVWNTNVTEFMGDNMLTGLKLDNPHKGSDELSIQGCFIAIGHIINNELAKQLGLELDSLGQIKIDRDSKTNVQGVYAAGDCVDSHFKQAITGVAEGVSASHSAYEYLNH